MRSAPSQPPEDRLQKHWTEEIIDQTLAFLNTIAEQMGLSFTNTERSMVLQMLVEDREAIMRAVQSRNRTFTRIPRDRVTEGNGWVNQRAAVETISLELAVRAALLLFSRRISARGDRRNRS